MTTIKSLYGSKIYSFNVTPCEFATAEIGWERLRETMADAFDVFEELERAMGYDARSMDREQLRRAHATRDLADMNADMARNAVGNDIYALARAMHREGWGTYLRAIERVESYYRECYRERFGDR